VPIITKLTKLATVSPKATSPYICGSIYSVNTFTRARAPVRDATCPKKIHAPSFYNLRNLSFLSEGNLLKILTIK
jgi:hypothetical protein